jgi:glycosyltransferase involved in cell wall biosynthesis
MADGTISYTYRDAQKAISDIPDSPVWVAPNSLYRTEMIVPAPVTDSPRDSVIYVGRFAPAKKVSLLLEAFALASRSEPGIRLILVGGGVQETQLRELAKNLGLSDNVDFPGWIDDLDVLTPYYSRSFCSASPGFAGLGLTQSLGFGIPMVVADKEPHSPEIELEASGGVTYFQSDSPDALAKESLSLWEERDQVPRRDLSDFTKSRYSAEAMANGLRSALEDRRDDKSRNVLRG